METGLSTFNGFLEWTIEDFSSWNRGIHGRSILSPKIYKIPHTVNIKLYPKGYVGHEENLTVDISEITDKYPCELTFIGSDGSILQIVQCADELKNFISGPKFSEIVSHTRMNDRSHNDVLTLQVGTNSLNGNYKLRSKINVFQTHVKLTPDILRDFTLNRDQFLLSSYLPQNKCMLGFNLYASNENSSQDDEKMVFILSPISNSRDALVRSSVSICNDDVTIRCDETEHVLKNRITIISDSLSLKELIKDNCSLHIRLKVVFDGNPDCASFRFKKKVELLTSAIGQPSTGSVPTTLSKELMCLYRDSDYADFKLHCGNFEFPIHKCILSARSTVFKSLLSSNMKEATSGTMEIPDLDPPTLGRFLTFLYAETVDDLDWNAALRLYYAADKYHVTTLKGVCKAFLGANITSDNVCALLSLADRHKDFDLASAANAFILENFNDVLRTEEWEAFMESDPNLLLKTVTRLGKNNCVGKLKTM